jgi:hypothetical protein
LWGLQRTGRRIREAVDQALTAASRQSGARRDGEFYSLDGQQEVAVRDRSVVDSTTLRQPKMLPPVEIRQALTAIVEVHLGATRDEVIIEAARLFGFRMTSVQLREVIEREVDWLVEHQGLDERNGKLYMKEIARLKV